MPNIPSSMPPIPPDQPSEELAERILYENLFDYFSAEIAMGEPTTREQLLKNFAKLASSRTELGKFFEVYHKWGVSWMFQAESEKEAMERLSLFQQALEDRS